MSDSVEGILLIITDSADEPLGWARQRYGNVPLAVLSFAPDTADRPLPDAWQRLRTADLLDEETLSRDFLAFLDAWPRQPLMEGRSFDQMFRRPGGYSVWWTGPGAERHPDFGVFADLKTLWIFDRAIKACSASRVLIFTRQAKLAWSLASRCRREGRDFEFLPGSARATVHPGGKRLNWLCESLAWLLLLPWAILMRALCARLLARTPRETRRQRNTPAVVFASPFSSYRWDRGRISMDRWRGLFEAMARLAPGIRCRYLGRSWGWSKKRGTILSRYYAEWRVLRKLDAAAPIPERYLACGAQLGSVLGHLTSLLRYARLERTAAFRDSFCFAGADVSSLYLPMLRRTFARWGQWTQAVGAVVKSLRAVGHVRALVMSEELYHVGMIYIAAARELGIPTIGFQHGTIMPAHLVYTLPPGQVQESPVPDYFAAFGEYAKETVSVHGAFPAERVWIVGASWFDHVVKDPPDAARARRRLGLPQDKRIVLMTMQRYPWFQEAAKVIFEVAKDMKDCVVCLKVHPIDVPLDVYRRIAQRLGATNVRFFEEQFGELLAACDVLIGGSSTTVLEAILMGRRTICINFTDEPDRYPYVADGGSLGARSAGQLRAALDKVFSPEAQEELEAGRRAFLERHAAPSADGEGSDTFVQMLLARLRREDRDADFPAVLPPSTIRSAD